MATLGQLTIFDAFRTSEIHRTETSSNYSQYCGTSLQESLRYRNGWVGIGWDIGNTNMRLRVAFMV